MKKVTISLIAVFLAISAGQAAAASNGKIAFTGWDGSRTRIYVMNADGSDVTALTDSVHGDHAPAWSPDGTKIAFSSNREGASQLWLMNADGTGQTKLFESPCGDLWAPGWSPDGTKLVFSHCWGWIASINVDGSGSTDLWFAGGFGSGLSPSWSPDGTKITFSDNESIFVMGTDGSNVTQLTSTNTTHPNYDPNWPCGLDDDPEWSRDGTRIVFHRQDQCSSTNTNPVIFIMDADGRNQIQLTNHAETGGDWAPSWSPDGTKIVFRRDDPVTFDTLGIWIMNADGSGQTSVGGVMPYSDHPSWQPVSEPATPAAAIEELITLVNTLVASGDLTFGEGVALATTLRGALQKLAAGKSSAAKSQLGAFVNQVDALVKSRRLSPAQGLSLATMARSVIERL